MFPKLRKFIDAYRREGKRKARWARYFASEGSMEREW